MQTRFQPIDGSSVGREVLGWQAADDVKNAAPGGRSQALEELLSLVVHQTERQP